MSRRIGEALVDRGVLTKSQLDKALEAQLVHGGTVGTCLIELGFVDEAQLGQALSEIQGVPYLAPVHLRDIPEEVLACVPAEIARKHRVVPVGMDATRLRVAMIDPKDLAALDELSFASGLHIEPGICPEIRLMHAMEHYYDIPRSRRFIVLSPEEEPWWKSSAKAAPADKSEVVAATSVSPAVSATGVSIGPIADSRFPDEPEPEPAPVGLEALDRPALLGGDVHLPGDRGPAEVLDQLSSRLCRAESKAELGSAAVDAATAGLTHAVLFHVEYYCARVWEWRGFDLDAERANRIAFPLTNEPVFELLAGEQAYRGPVPRARRFVPFFRELKLQHPREILLVPLHLDDRLVAVLYGDGGDGAIRGDTADYRRVMEKLRYGVQIAALRRMLERA